MSYQLVLRSKNRKVKLPASSSDRSTCPDNCSLKGDGCYAEAGYYTKINWNHLDAGTRGTDWETFIARVSDLPTGQAWRHNVAGDLRPNPNDITVIDETSLDQLVRANKGKRGFTYTHYSMDGIMGRVNRTLVTWANRQGFTINASTENINQAVDLKEQEPEMPVVTIVSRSFGDWKSFDHKGHTIVRCPAEYREGSSCKTCMLCAQSKRTSIVGFTAHGTKAAAVDLIATDAV